MTTYCKHQNAQTWVKTRTADGKWRVVQKCSDCNKIHGQSLAQSMIDLSQLEEYERQYSNPGCAVCGQRDTQLHHWFPQALARKANVNPDMWPTAYLCQTCHDLWHRIVTPALLNRPAPKDKARHNWEAPQP